MGHAIFLALHLGAILFGAVLLVVTIPLHLSYAVLRGRQTGAAHDQAPQVHCPACRELVRHDATLCKHCGTVLTPTPLRQPLFEERYGIAIAIGTLIVMGLAAKACT